MNWICEYMCVYVLNGHRGVVSCVCFHRSTVMTWEHGYSICVDCSQSFSKLESSLQFQVAF